MNLEKHDSDKNVCSFDWSELFFFFACQGQEENENILGLWEALDPGSEEPFNYILEVCNGPDNEPVGYLSIPALSVDNAKLDTFTYSDDTLYFVLHQGHVQMSFSGVLSDSEIAGKYQGIRSGCIAVHELFKQQKY
ncbi:hypothetical protein [Parapedobacter tibetensis]|uniref:hypothetical protein n=1 Tax=Parapedobacter tibetensis TaxID=2972951 RepID=UPI00214D4BFA|nr:hypothetical protein [Parapedobacter tibetensis]